MPYVFSASELAAQKAEAAKYMDMVARLEHYADTMDTPFFREVAQAISSLARDLRANMQILDEIARNGPVGVRLAVRRAQGQVHPPWPGGEPVEWQQTANKEFYRYDIGWPLATQLIVRELGFDETYQFIADYDRGALLLEIYKGERS
jgi:hypothetical protein